MYNENHHFFRVFFGVYETLFLRIRLKKLNRIYQVFANPRKVSLNREERSIFREKVAKEARISFLQKSVKEARSSFLQKSANFLLNSRLQRKSQIENSFTSFSLILLCKIQTIPKIFWITSKFKIKDLHKITKKLNSLILLIILAEEALMRPMITAGRGE